MMPGDTLLIEILSLMAVAVTAATLFSRLGLGAILGYLVGGALIGPFGLGLIKSPEGIAHLGEFGVVFLLFLIGVELKPSRLWVMRRHVFGLGSAQLLITGALLSLLAAFGLGLGIGPAVIIGFGLALSSTAFGVQLMATKGQLSSQWGRASFSVLLFQDLAVVPLLALVPALGHAEFTLSMSLGLAFLESVAILAAAIIGGRLLINPVISLVASSRTPEVFTALALLLVLGFGWLMEHAGLSMAMGAFLAGVLLADSAYRHQIELDIQPFRGLLLGLFFISVGMGLDIRVLTVHTGTILTLLTVLLALKAVIVTLLMRLSKLTLPDAIKAGALLSQAGEFGFVLFAYAKAEGVMTPDLTDTLTAVIALGMGLTPLLVMLAERLAPRAAPAPAPEVETERDGHVLIAGFGRVGETVARMLKELGLPATAIDLDPDNVARARALGIGAYYGDASRAEILNAVGAKNATLLVLTMRDPKTVEHTLEAAQRQFPSLPVHARAHDLDTADRLLGKGARHTVPETLESSLQLGAEVARAGGAEADHVQALLNSLRAGDYHAFRTATGAE